MKIQLDADQSKVLMDRFDVDVMQLEIHYDELSAASAGKDWVTTMAIGEEDIVTTMAIGEEDDGTTSVLSEG